jgi:hypothetical protein
VPSVAEVTLDKRDHTINPVPSAGVDEKVADAVGGIARQVLDGVTAPPEAVACWISPEVMTSRVVAPVLRSYIHRVDFTHNKGLHATAPASRSLKSRKWVVVAVLDAVYVDHQDLRFGQLPVLREAVEFRLVADGDAVVVARRFLTPSLTMSRRAYRRRDAQWCLSPSR